MPQVSNITNEELAQKLRESHLETYQKNELIRMVSHMTDAEKNEALKLISMGQDVKKKEDAAIASHQDELIALNEEFDKKTQQLEHESSQQLRTALEKLESKEEKTEMESLESELKNL